MKTRRSYRHVNSTVTCNMAKLNLWNLNLMSFPCALNEISSPHNTALKENK
jgi:hypothetical protein